MMRALAVLLIAVNCAQATLAAAAAITPGTSDQVVAQVAARLHDLALADADVDGKARWAFWSEGRLGDTTVQLALFSVDNGRATSIWRAAWPHAYEPVLRPTPEWSYAGRPVLAATFHYGAAAEELELYGLDKAGRPSHLVERLASAVDWTISPSGDLLAVLYDRPASALVATCYGWNGQAAVLKSEPCPR